MTAARTAPPVAGPSRPTLGRDDRLRMVNWYDPSQILRTGVDVAVSTLIGQQVDRRLIEALDSPGVKPTDHDYSNEVGSGEDLWIDYVADTGDGWDATFAVATAVARPALRLAAPDGTTHDTRPGRILILGGDEAYPVGSREAYKARLIAPWQEALGEPAARDREARPHVFAIPGNHDWYDGLVAWTRLFCQQRSFAGRPTSQRRSYFALKLPRGWWLIGTDIQLGVDIDATQRRFFEAVVDAMAPEDRVIVCNAIPGWIERLKYAELDPTRNDENLQFLETRILEGRVRAFIAGDLHHYRRHASPDGDQKITAGGGGAFLHPTNDLPPERADESHRLEASYPTPEESARMAWRCLAFPFLNWKFSGIIAALYVLAAWTIVPQRAAQEAMGGSVARAFLDNATRGPAAVGWALAVLLAFWLFTDTASKRYRWTAGTIHGLAHLVAACSLGLLAWRVAGGAQATDSTITLLGKVAEWCLVVLGGGWLVGGLIMGTYLLVSLNVFKRHSNEAFSALRIADFRNFLRLRIQPDGSLVIYPIGIRRVARTRNGGVPVAQRADHEPALIEAPIVVPKDGPATTLAGDEITVARRG